MERLFLYFPLINNICRDFGTGTIVPIPFAERMFGGLIDCINVYLADERRYIPPYFREIYEFLLSNIYVPWLKTSPEKLAQECFSIPAWFAAEGLSAELQFYFAGHPAKQYSDVCFAAAKYGHLKCLQIARDAGCVWDRYVEHRMVEIDADHYRSVIVPKQAPWDPPFIYGCQSDMKQPSTSYAGPVLEPARFRAIPHHDDGVCEIAVRGGHLDCLRWAREHGCPWLSNAQDPTTSSEDKINLPAPEDATNALIIAATYGHFNCLCWIHEKEHPMHSISVVKCAAQYGHFECLQWLCEHEYPWDASVLDSAVKGHNPDCIQYAREQNVSTPRSSGFSSRQISL